MRKSALSPSRLRRGQSRGIPSEQNFTRKSGPLFSALATIYFHEILEACGFNSEKKQALSCTSQT